ncbi:MAG TPA: hypothetical protein P5079_04540 [Elusimicrobiota bacterium]|nr:hypothetical protein [Elusimicrobiota bacterium]
MIERWEIVADPHERFPNRHRVSVAGEESDVQSLLAAMARKAGKPWALRRGAFRFAFYLYDPTEEDRRRVEKFLAGDRPTVSGKTAVSPEGRSALPPESSPVKPFSWEEAGAEVEVLSDLPPAAGKPSREETKPSAGSSDWERPSLVESATDALMSWAETGPTERKPSSVPPASPAEPPPPTIQVERTEKKEEEEDGEDSPPSGLIVATEETGMPMEEMVVSSAPEPEVPKGYLMFRLGYFIPHDIGGVADRIHSLFSQTLETRHMPFVFHKVFTFPYRWPDRPLVDQVIAGCQKHKIDGLVCVGDEKRLELLFEQCQEKGIKHHFLRREDTQKKYWRLGLITRIVVTDY